MKILDNLIEWFWKDKPLYKIDTKSYFELENISHYYYDESNKGEKL